MLEICSGRVFPSLWEFQLLLFQTSWVVFFTCMGWSRLCWTLQQVPQASGGFIATSLPATALHTSCLCLPDLSCASIRELVGVCVSPVYTMAQMFPAQDMWDSGSLSVILFLKGPVLLVAWCPVSWKPKSSKCLLDSGGMINPIPEITFWATEVPRDFY